jgi:hypothetical protein
MRKITAGKPSLSRDERVLLNRFATALDRLAVMHVFVSGEPFEVHIRDGCRTDRKQVAVPDDAKFVGAYRQPFSTRDILADVYDLLADLPAVPPVAIRPKPPASARI